MVRQIGIAPNERYALLGKTRSGKTTYAMFLASVLVPRDKRKAQNWEVWWVDTKDDQRDLSALKEWGFGEKKSARRIFSFRPTNGERQSVVDQVQELCFKALDTGGVLLVIDEYTQVTKSTQNAGPGLLDAFTRGGGKMVGVIGLTQEPVFIPRQLISQASHVCLFDLSYQQDVDYVRKYLPTYQRPLLLGDKHGFFHGSIDEDALWSYYHNEREWHKSFTAIPPITERISA